MYFAELKTPRNGNQSDFYNLCVKMGFNFSQKFLTEQSIKLNAICLHFVSVSFFDKINANIAMLSV